MKALLVAVAAFFTCWSVLPAADIPDGGGSSAQSSGGAPLSGVFVSGSSSSGIPLCLGLSLQGARTPLRGSQQPPRGRLPGTSPNSLALPDEGFDRDETRFRRFEIVFFTSLPASVLLSLLGVIAFRGAAGGAGGFSAVEYRYLAFSTIGISLALAASDGGNAYGNKTYRRGHR
jgi:hypothetical protein